MYTLSRIRYGETRSYLGNPSSQGTFWISKSYSKEDRTGASSMLDCNDYDKSSFLPQQTGTVAFYRLKSPGTSELLKLKVRYERHKWAEKIFEAISECKT
jgi:hypothetical protein